MSQKVQKRKPNHKYTPFGWIRDEPKLKLDNQVINKWLMYHNAPDSIDYETEFDNAPDSKDYEKEFDNIPEWTDADIQSELQSITKAPISSSSSTSSTVTSTNLRVQTCGYGACVNHHPTNTIPLPITVGSVGGKTNKNKNARTRTSCVKCE